MAREHDGRAASGRRPQVLRILKGTPGPLSINDIADRLGVHPNTVRFHLDRLMESGQVERVETDRHTTGRPPLLFRPVRGMDPTGPRHYRLLAELLMQSLAGDPDRSARALELGRAWGRRQHSEPGVGAAAGAEGSDEAVARLMGLLDEIDFAPEKRQDKGLLQIGLRHCPFLELAEARPEIICPVHLGLMQGALEAWKAPVTVDRLDPFVEPDLCLAHLTSVGTS
jgi:predicted ArsR family transcriptional regulator